MAEEQMHKYDGTDRATPPETIPNAEGLGDAKAPPSSLEERVREILLGVRDWGSSLANQRDDDDPLEGIEPAVATTAILSLITDERLDELDRLPGNVADTRVYLPKRRAELKDQRRGK